MQLAYQEIIVYRQIGLALICMQTHMHTNTTLTHTYNMYTLATHTAHTRVCTYAHDCTYTGKSNTSVTCGDSLHVCSLCAYCVACVRSLWSVSDCKALQTLQDTSLPSFVKAATSLIYNESPINSYSQSVCSYTDMLSVCS